MRSRKLAVLLALATSGAVCAQPMPDTAAALKTLMGSSSQPGTGVSAQQQPLSAPQGLMVQTKAGDTLAKILAAHLGPHPYDAKKLHQAIAAMNPHAFNRGNPNRLIAGSVLRIPSQHELHAVMMGQAPVVAHMQGPMPTPHMAPMPPTAATGFRQASANGFPNVHSNAPTGAEDFERHRGWVRFPR